MALKIMNAFSDAVFFDVTKLRNWNLPEVIRHEMLRSGGKFYFISHRRLSQRNTVEEAQSWYGVHSRTRELWICKLCRDVKTHLDTST